MATVPISGTNIRLLRDIPFSNDYRHTRWFDTKTEQDSFFLGLTPVFGVDEMNFQRIEGKYFLSIPKSIDELWGVNYMMFRNAQYDNKWFYGFVTKLEYKQKNTTYVHFQIDVLQTWMFNIQFKPSFIVREHCKLWNSDGTPVINTIDEGLNYGTDYETVSVENYVPYETIQFLVIVSKEAMHSNGAGINYEGVITPTQNGLPQPLSYYIHPFKMDGTSPNIFVGGQEVIATPILELLKGIYSQESAVNNVVSLYITEFTGQNLSYNSGTDTLTFDSFSYEKAVISDNQNANLNTVYVKAVSDYNTVSKVFPDKYAGYVTSKESKLLMHPYTSLTLDDFKGNRITLKNEYIASKDLSITAKGSMGTSNKVAYTVDNYNIRSNVDFPHIVSLESSVINNNPNDIPIITDLLSAYLQGNRNSIENQKNSIYWNATMGVVNGGLGGLAGARSGDAVGAVSSLTGMVTGAGNGVLQLQAIEAKQKDIDNVPPSISKMGSNTNFDYGNDIKGVFIIKKQIRYEYRKKLEDFFNMYGYKVNEVKLPNFHTRRFWNYVQTSNCVIRGSFNNEDLQELKSIFDNGITLWHTADIGNYELDNEVL